VPNASLMKLLAISSHIVPPKIPTALMAFLGNRLLSSQQLLGRLGEIEGSRICLHVRDLHLQMIFQINGSRLTSSSNRHWDMRISGTLANFFKLATRNEDPDTLFFNRNLVLEGKTETGLYVKNLLDAVDLDFSSQFAAVTGTKPPEFLSRLVRTTSQRVRSAIQR